MTQTSGNLKPNDLSNALNSPSIKNSKPDQVIPNLMNMFGIDDLEPVNPDETEAIRHIYFQANTLSADKWTELPGVNNTVQIIPFKLKEVPMNARLVVDVLVDKSDYEAEVFDKYIVSMSARGKSLIFYAKASLPVDIVVGLKCVDQLTGEPIYVPDEMLQRA